MKGVQQAIYVELDKIYDEAKMYLEFWMGRVARREVSRSNNKQNQEFTNYALLLEFNGNAFRIRWQRIQFVKHGTKVIRLTKSISVPKTLRYPKSSFRYADDWELDLILEVEEGVHILRKKVSALMKAHQTMLNASKLDGDELVVSSCRERVQPTTKSIAEIKKSLY
ncbi:hypothetical protein BCS93_04625 [Vibrio breoganii]|uniref:Uncharacterized protein n=1 Tax=Vibrio breoganii TaxID=553239 RepID=A0AAP8N083_9VIBR|nr:conjugative transfer protein MobI(A/C) [Vibrio breoganii]PMP14078.1 hypothetical protein BCS93_04625 [Vibrio breoganii]